MPVAKAKSHARRPPPGRTACPAGPPRSGGGSGPSTPRFRSTSRKVSGTCPPSSGATVDSKLVSPALFDIGPARLGAPPSGHGHHLELPGRGGETGEQRLIAGSDDGADARGSVGRLLNALFVAPRIENDGSEHAGDEGGDEDCNLGGGVVRGVGERLPRDE